MPSERTSWTRARKLPGESSSAGMAVPPFVDRSVQVSGMCSRRPSGSSTNARGPSSLATLRIRRTIWPTRGWCHATIRTQSVWPSKRGASCCRLFRAGEGPIAPADGHPAQRPLGRVVAETDPAFREEAGEGGPAFEHVVDGPGDLGMGRALRALPLPPSRPRDSPGRAAERRVRMRFPTRWQAPVVRPSLLSTFRNVLRKWRRQALSYRCARSPWSATFPWRRFSPQNGSVRLLSQRGL